MPVQVRLKIDLNWLEHEGFKVLVEEIWGIHGSDLQCAMHEFSRRAMCWGKGSIW